MFCNQCGKEIPNGVKFCPTCGAPVPQTNETTDFQQTTATGTGAMAGSGMGTETVTNPKLGSLTLPGTTKTVQWILSCVVGGMQFLSAVVFWWIGLFAVSASVSMFGMSQNQSESVSLHDLFDWKFFSVFFMILVFISAVWMILRVVDEKIPLSFLSPVRPMVRFFAPLLSLVTGALTLIVFPVSVDHRCGRSCRCAQQPWIFHLFACQRFISHYILGRAVFVVHACYHRDFCLSFGVRVVP